MDRNQCSCSLCYLPTRLYIVLINVTNQLDYSCANCHKSVGNRPNCSNPVSESVVGYSKVYPKVVDICKPCLDPKKDSQVYQSFFK